MDKAYIVANKKQELDVLKKFEQEGLVWADEDKPTEWLPSEKGFLGDDKLPYILFEREYVGWGNIEELEDEEVVFDGRKEEKMYKVTQEFMNKMIEWRDDEDINATNGERCNYVISDDLDDLPGVAVAWWIEDKNPIERNNRLIAIIKWLNGEDVFEVEMAHKFIVRSENTNADKYYTYVEVDEGITTTVYSVKYATNFYTREEAQEWANSHQVVIEIGEEGNEVE